MKSSYDGSMTESCEPRLKPCAGDREPVLRKLYINLCNLIVESRIPGINERGYGEGIHCPPLLGPNTHCCDLSIPECQKHQKLMHRLLRSMKRNIFEVEVFLLPDCCQETKLTERIPKKEYILLERWSFNCFHGSKIQSSIDVAQLLRAVRSFLYFSQISAWLSASEGKTPSKIYYWVRPSAEISSAKFESDPEIHHFPLCKIYEGLYGTVEVRYRTRTQYVPIIPCSKHPPQENPLITVIADTDASICIGTHLVKQLQKTCDTSHGSSISEKSVNGIETRSCVLAPSNNTSTLTKTFIGEMPDSITNLKSKGILKHSNCQTYSDNISKITSNVSQDINISVNINLNLMPQISNNGTDIYFRNPSQKYTSLQKHISFTSRKSGGKQRKISLDSSDSASIDSGLGSLDSSSTSPLPKQKIKRNISKQACFKNLKSFSHCNSSSSNIMHHSSPLKVNGLNNDCESNHSTADALKQQNLSKAQTRIQKLSFAKSNILSNNLLQSTSYSRSKVSSKSLNCSKSSLVVSDCPQDKHEENEWCLGNSPISPKIIISKCEPLMPQETSVPKKTEISHKVIKRKCSKREAGCAKRCNCVLPDEYPGLVKYISSIESKTNNGVNAGDFEDQGSSNSIFHSLLRKKKVKVNSRKKCYKYVAKSEGSSKSVTELSLQISNVISEEADKNSLQNINPEVKREIMNKNPYVHRAGSKRKIREPVHRTEEVIKSPKIKSCSSDIKISSSFPTALGFKITKSRKRKLDQKLDTQSSNLECKVTSVFKGPRPASESSILSNILSNTGDKHISVSSSKVKKKNIKAEKVDRKRLSKAKKLQLSGRNVNSNASQNCVIFSKMNTANESLLASSSEKVNTVLDKNNEIYSSTLNQTNYTLPSEPSLIANVQFSSGHILRSEKNTYLGASNKQGCDLTKHTELHRPCIIPSLSCSVQNIQSIALNQKLNRNIGYMPSHKSNFKKGRRLLLNFEESILNGCLLPVSKVDGFKAEIGASGSFCPGHLTLPADVSFFELGNPQQSAAPYMAHVAFGETEYFLPKKGALQVTLFNPSKTVVKMFVLNYNLTSMPPMCHTFIRQKTYYMPVGATEKDPSTPKWLRYIIHLRFASSKTGRIFLHKDFKIVVLNKSNDDAASDHIQEPRELRSFLSVPKNPTFSSL